MALVLKSRARPERSNNGIKSVDIQVTVVRANNLPKAHKLRKPSYYVVLSVDAGQEYKTTQCDGSVTPKWDEGFTFSTHISSRLQLQVHCAHCAQKRGGSHILGQTEDLTILNSSRNEDVTMDLHVPGGNVSSRGLGSITIHLKVRLAWDAISEASIGSGPRTLDDLARIGIVTNILQSDRISPQWGSLLTSLANLVKLAGSFAELDPKAKAALGAVTFAFEVVMKQIELDDRITGLVGTMANVYGFLQDANPLEKIKSYEKTVERLVRQTAECCYFIAEYSKTGSFAQRAVTNLISNAEMIIAAYETSFGELKIEFIMGSTLQTALTTVRILDKVEHIANLINLDRLPYMKNASWNPDRACVRGTHVSLTDDIIRWIPCTTPTSRDHVERVYLLLGGPRCGKSSISHTIARRMHEEGRLGSAIFLARDGSKRRKAQNVFSTIAYDLAAFDRKIEEGISRMIHANPSIATAPIARQFQDLIVGPTRDLTIIGPVLIIIDGLDECQGTEHGRLLQILAEESSQLPPNFRILITARTDSNVEAAFRDIDDYHRWEMDFEDMGNIRDINLYIEETLKELATTNPAIFGKHMIDAVQCQFVKRAMEIPLWVSVACGFLGNAMDGECTRFLDTLLSKSFPVTTEAAMDHLYHAILCTSFSEHPNFEIGWHLMFGHSVELSSFSYELLSPIRTASGSCLIDILVKIGCIRNNVDAEGRYTTIPHPAFYAFITDRQRCTDNRFCVDNTVGDYADICLRVMNNLLSLNICRIEDSSLLNSELADIQVRIQRFVPEGLRYASQHWVAHLTNSDLKHDLSRTLELLRQFLFKHLLHWIELSSLTGQLDEASVSLKGLNKWLGQHVAHNSDLIVMTSNGIDFIHAFSEIISTAALHTYISALPLASSDTLLYESYITKSVTKWSCVISPDAEWSCTRILEGHSHGVYSVAFSPDGSKIVSGSPDKTVRIWDARQGFLVGQPLRGHTSGVTSIACSPTSPRIASGSWDSTVRVWDTNTRKLVRELAGHSSSVRCVAYSPDGSRIASGSVDQEIRIWDANTGKLVGKPFTGHTNDVYCVTFSPDGKQIASGSFDKTVRIWDAQLGIAIGEPLKGHTSRVFSVAWSPNGSLLASGSDDSLICLWDAQTRHTILKLQGHSSVVASVAFSPDSSKLTSASWDKTIRLWDVRKGDCIGKLQGHSNDINSVAFSFDGRQIASGADDNVRVWAVKQPQKITFTPRPKPSPVVTDHSRNPFSLLLKGTFGYAAYVDANGWICTSTGSRVVWVPIPGGKISVELDSLIVEGETRV